MVIDFKVRNYKYIFKAAPYRIYYEILHLWSLIQSFLEHFHCFDCMTLRTQTTTKYLSLLHIINQLINSRCTNFVIGGC